jgi:hypothetical protein
MTKGNKDFVSITRVAFEQVQWHPTYKNIIIEGIDEAGDKRVHLQLLKFTSSYTLNPIAWGREFDSVIETFIQENCVDTNGDMYDKIITALFPIGEYKP